MQGKWVRAEGSVGEGSDLRVKGTSCSEGEYLCRKLNNYVGRPKNGRPIGNEAARWILNRARTEVSLKKIFCFCVGV